MPPRNDRRPAESTYCGDPEARFTVSSMSDRDGSGIQGYYTNEWAAHRIAKWCKSRGHTNVKVEAYNASQGFNWPTNVHPLIQMTLGD